MSDWIEVRLKRDAAPGEFYAWLGPAAERVHHFWDEPWWPNGYVIRLNDPAVNPEDCSLVDHTILWDATEDEELYGDYWEWVQQFFEASSILASRPDLNNKLVHCVLNARGFSWTDEIRYGLAMAWGRAKIIVKWRLYLKRRWWKAHPNGVEVHEAPLP